MTRKEQTIEIEIDLITHEVTIKGGDVDNIRTKGDAEMHQRIDDIAKLFGNNYTTVKSKPVDKQERRLVTRQSTYQER